MQEENLKIPEANPRRINARLPRIIYLNGPRFSGKHTLAKWFEELPGVNIIDHENPLWQIADTYIDSLPGGTDLDPMDYTDVDVRRSAIYKNEMAFAPYTWEDFFREQRNMLLRITPNFLNLAIINAIDYTLASTAETIVIPSIMSNADVLPLMALAPIKEQLVIRITRPNYPFGPEESHVFSNIPSFDLNNNGTIEDMYRAVKEYLEYD